MTTADNTLHIWKIPLNNPGTELKQLMSVLSEEEQKTALRFKFEKHQRRYIVSHAAMRQILANLLGTTLQDLKITNTKLKNGMSWYLTPLSLVCAPVAMLENLIGRSTSMMCVLKN